MIIIRSPTTLCAMRGSKFRDRSSENLDLLLVPRFAPFALFSPREPRYEQTD